MRQTLKSKNEINIDSKGSDRLSYRGMRQGLISKNEIDSGMKG